MSKTPKPTNLKASTDAPKTGTQKKALNVVQVVDVDSDEEEVEGKVLLEKPSEKKGTKKEWTDRQKALLWKLRDTVVEQEEDINVSGKTVNMSDVINHVLLIFPVSLSSFVFVVIFFIIVPPKNVVEFFSPNFVVDIFEKRPVKT